MIYHPYAATLTLQSSVDYPSGIRATLYDDRERAELASVSSADGHFEMVVPDLPVNEVYFLKLEGKRRAFGMEGLTWEERVPVYVSAGSEAVQLVGNPYSGPESVSQMRFYVGGGGAVQAALTAGGANLEHAGPHAHDTADFGPQSGNLRVDYVLPSTGLEYLGGRVYWPAPDDPRAPIVEGSDHRLVWADLRLQ